jgi:hypothetical protein
VFGAGKIAGNIRRQDCSGFQDCERALKIDQEYGVSSEPNQYAAASVGVQIGRRSTMKWIENVLAPYLEWRNELLRPALEIDILNLFLWAAVATPELGQKCTPV